MLSREDQVLKGGGDTSSGRRGGSAATPTLHTEKRGKRAPPRLSRKKEGQPKKGGTGLIASLQSEKRGK